MGLEGEYDPQEPTVEEFEKIMQFEREGRVHAIMVKKLDQILGYVGETVPRELKEWVAPYENMVWISQPINIRSGMRLVIRNDENGLTIVLEDVNRQWWVRRLTYA